MGGGGGGGKLTGWEKNFLVNSFPRVKRLTWEKTDRYTGTQDFGSYHIRVATVWG